MKNNFKKIVLTLLLVSTSTIGFADDLGNGIEVKGDDGDVTGSSPAAPVDDWILPFVLVSAAVGYYAFRRKQSNSAA